MLSEFERGFLADRRVGHLATADREGVPHVVPVCFAVSESTAYVTIDEKPKSDRAPRNAYGTSWKTRQRPLWLTATMTIGPY